MLHKALATMFVCASIAGGVGCEKTGNHFVYVTVPAASQLVVFREDPYSGDTYAAFTEPFHSR